MVYFGGQSYGAHKPFENMWIMFKFETTKFVECSPSSVSHVCCTLGL